MPRASVSVILEWETALAAERTRGARCLRAMHRELSALGGDGEMLVCFDPRTASRESVVQALDDAAGGCDWPVSVEAVAVPQGLDYYGKKNYGFARSHGDVIVFLDSDLIPEPGCLAELIAPFDDFRKSVIVGRTHLDTTTLYERAVALFWIFETREQTASLRPTQRLLSNSFSVRRAVFTHFHFPQRPTFRGPCSELAETLTRYGIPMFEQTSARASHPAPAGIGAFLVRAFHAGTDEWFYDGFEAKASLARALRQWRIDLRHVAERIARRRNTIDSGASSVALAYFLGFVYYSTKIAGYTARLATATAPRPSEAARQEAAD